MLEIIKESLWPQVWNWRWNFQRLKCSKWLKIQRFPTQMKIPFKKWNLVEKNLLNWSGILTPQRSKSLILKGNYYPVATKGKL